eukprot:scaffold52524_cov65-Cyclotella_meneghiniana.AAC.1
MSKNTSHHHQARRANTCESAVTNSNTPTTEQRHIPTLRPNDDAIQSVLEGKKIAQEERHWQLFSMTFMENLLCYWIRLTWEAQQSTGEVARWRGVASHVSYALS